MTADPRFECAQCILLHSVGIRRDQERAVNLLRGLRAIEVAPAVLQLVVASRFQILQFLCEFFRFDVRYHALHSQLLVLHIHTLVDSWQAASATRGPLSFSLLLVSLAFAFQSPHPCKPSI